MAHIEIRDVSKRFGATAAQMQAPNTVRLVEVEIDHAVAARHERDSTLSEIHRSAMSS